MRNFVTTFATAALCGAAVVLPSLPAEADVKLHRLLSDGMVVQRRAPFRVRGKANPGERVSVSMNRKFSVTTAGADGSFETVLPAMEAGGPYLLTVQGGDSKEVTVKDVLVGEVWVCSGQSNMEWNMAWLGNTKDEIARANDPQLRMFTVPKAVLPTPADDLAGGAWLPTAPKNTGNFSAVGYYFGKYLRQSLKVPVGLIHTSWGGTRIEAWTARDVLVRQGTPPSEFMIMDQSSPEYQLRKARYEKYVAEWKAAGSPAGQFADPGIVEKAKGWEKENAEGPDWKAVNVPGLWEQSGVEELGNLDGGVWFRREFVVTEAGAGKEATLTLGAIDDFDQTFINGVKVGQTGAETPNFWQHPRRYVVPAGVLKPGRNVIAVRVWDHTGGGGFAGPGPGSCGRPFSIR
jgi:sialate O-acetylesterase